MKAIIIAAGAGRRLKNLTEDKPKCLLDINGKTILEIQMDALYANGINDIIIIKGYKKEMISYDNVKYYINDDYENNNILNSLFYAGEEIIGDVVIVYSDIIYSKEIISDLIKLKEDIVVVADMAWEERYKGRIEHPIDEAENVIISEENKVVEIGKQLFDKKKVNGEFIGIMKLSANGSEIFRNEYYKVKETLMQKSFVRAKTFQQAYLTDMIQHLINIGVTVTCLSINGGWYEIDTKEDYLFAVKGLSYK